MNQKNYKRGCKPTPRHKLAKATWAGPKLKSVTPPANYVSPCLNYSMGGNDQYGDCVSAEEANAKRAYSIALNETEIAIPDATVIDWASKNGFLNGADLDTVLTEMESDGMADAKGVIHCDGTHAAVDWTNKAEVQAAIYTYKTLKIAVAADQLQNVVNGINGWCLFAQSLIITRTIASVWRAMAQRSFAASFAASMSPRTLTQTNFAYFFTLGPQLA